MAIANASNRTKNFGYQVVVLQRCYIPHAQPRFSSPTELLLMHGGDYPFHDGRISVPGVPSRIPVQKAVYAYSSALYCKDHMYP